MRGCGWDYVVGLGEGVRGIGTCHPLRSADGSMPALPAKCLASSPHRAQGLYSTTLDTFKANLHKFKLDGHLQAGRLQILQV